MRNVIYGMGVSLDGFIADRDGAIDWSAPDEELHRFHNDQARATGVNVCGRRLYEVMRFWETASEQNPSAPEHEHEFERLWKATPRLVASRTLDAVHGGAELIGGDVAEEVARLKRQAGGDISIGGAGLAASLLPLGLVDELRVFVYPVLLGGGTPFLPPLDARITLRLEEFRTFPSQVMYLRYTVA
jgi:dihydrofolate reductase